MPKRTHGLAAKDPRHECRYCMHRPLDKGRAMDGRRAYRCPNCGTTTTYGMQGRKRRYSVQRGGYQFHDTGAAKLTKHDRNPKAIARMNNVADFLNSLQKTHIG